MKVSSTEVQNNFGKYLLLATQEDVVITRNGAPIARLSSIKAAPDRVMEQALPYGVDGKAATYEEYVKLVESSEERYEYIDGHIYLLASPRTAHQRALGELYVILYNRFRGGKCVPMTAPYDITLYRAPESINVVQPDVMVICDLEEHLDNNDYYQGVPSLVVEIISESTRRKDLIKKLDLYMSCGVAEYWIVNPLNREVTIYRFENKNIVNHATYKNSETATSFLFPDLSVDLGQLFR